MPAWLKQQTCLPDIFSASDILISFQWPTRPSETNFGIFSGLLNPL
ncbi:hypothetical protein AB395_00003112 [Sinorhizobium fredii CCBAU 45436]|nr:hypothetical protein AB395_00003112 [Sinorhizobium fredii CCBAU 45436]